RCRPVAPLRPLHHFVVPSPLLRNGKETLVRSVREWSVGRMHTRHIQTDGLRQQILEAGSGPLVLLIHGFPELGVSWRAQVQALADAGFHAVAPDMRGYGGTDKPEARDAHAILHLVGDMVDLVRALGETQCVVVGHDWGAPVAWHCALTRP